jgi:N6-adenosine-specific RNA methylase IME4
MYRTILIDPPWEQGLMGKRKRKRDPNTRQQLEYPTMTLKEIAALPIPDLADTGCHLWLWTTNQFLYAGFEIMKEWGVTYLAPITWRKPTGTGNYFIHLTQIMLFGYFKRCCFNRERYIPNIFDSPVPKQHSRKPVESYELIERISDEPRLEIFARPLSPMYPIRGGWHVWGNEFNDPTIQNLTITDVEFMGLPIIT